MMEGEIRDSEWNKGRVNAKKICRGLLLYLQRLNLRNLKTEIRARCVATS
jgi:hypothetical protein